MTGCARARGTRCAVGAGGASDCRPRAAAAPAGCVHPQGRAGRGRAVSAHACPTEVGPPLREAAMHAPRNACHVLVTRSWVLGSEVPWKCCDACFRSRCAPGCLHLARTGAARSAMYPPRRYYSQFAPQHSASGLRHVCCKHPAQDSGPSPSGATSTRHTGNDRHYSNKQIATSKGHQRRRCITYQPAEARGAT